MVGKYAMACEIKKRFSKETIHFVHANSHKTSSKRWQEIYKIAAFEKG